MTLNEPPIDVSNFPSLFIVFLFDLSGASPNARRRVVCYEGGPKAAAMGNPTLRAIAPALFPETQPSVTSAFVFTWFSPNVVGWLVHSFPCPSQSEPRRPFILSILYRVSWLHLCQDVKYISQAFEYNLTYFIQQHRTRRIFSSQSFSTAPSLFQSQVSSQSISPHDPKKFGIYFLVCAIASP